MLAVAPFESPPIPGLRRETGRGEAKETPEPPDPILPMSEPIRFPASPRLRPPRVLLPFLALALAFSPTMLRSETYREFTNHSGQKLRAVIVSATDTEVTLKREDGGLVTGGISFFSSSDQTHIAKWREANPEQNAYDFDIKATRQRVVRE